MLKVPLPGHRRCPDDQGAGLELQEPILEGGVIPEGAEVVPAPLPEADPIEEIDPRPDPVLD